MGGIRSLVKINLDDARNIVIISVSLAIGVVPLAAPDVRDPRGQLALAIGVVPLAAPDVRDPRGQLVTPGIYHDFPSWAQTIFGSGISAGALTAVALNLLFHHMGARRRRDRVALAP
ncbi:hypothetical protein E6W39_38510 [Kitasatospora acidiphila]|uniref:Uncharacterized protein n=1 Tax=Kitasatospora acidiphila TaxID=2567942 RepID=A0A540WDB3_9ACTN|nr:hypothetical protein E6W39_38510 [Kitasatospora acidiphila]